MIKIDNASAKATRDAIIAAGAEGWWTIGNPGGGDPATIISPDFLNDLQAILRAVIDAGSVTPTKGPGGDNDLLTAINVVVGLGLPEGTLRGHLEITGNGTIELQPLHGTDVQVGIDDVFFNHAGPIVWDMATDLDGTEAPDQPLYLYVRNNAGVLDVQISTTAPDPPDGTKAGYKTADVTRRNVGSVWNNGAQNFTPAQYLPGGLVIFKSPDAGLRFELTLTDLEDKTTWSNLPINLPATAFAAVVNMAGRGTTANGMVVLGIDGATGTLTLGATDPSIVDDALLYCRIHGSQDSAPYAINGEIPITTPATPAISYGITRNLFDAFFIIRGYRDIFGPR